MISFTTRSTPGSQPLLLWLLILSLSILTLSTAEAANKKPIAKIAKLKAVNEQTEVTLNGEASKDPDGSIAGYLWQQTRGASVALTNADSAQPSFTTPLVKKITKLAFALTVTDNSGASSKTITTVTVKPVNAKPVANAGVDQTVELNKSVTLDGSASSDSDGVIKSWKWKQTGGPTVKLIGAKTSNPHFSGPRKLPLKFKLTVTDDEKGKASDEVTVTLQTGSVPTPPAPEPVTPSNISLSLESKDFTDNEVLVRDATGAMAKTLTWTVKNTSASDLTNVVLAPGTAAGGLTIGGISPTSIASWGKDTVQIFTVTVTAPISVGEGTNSQSWTLTYDNGKPLPFSGGQSLGFILKTPPCVEPKQAQSAVRPSFSKISAVGGKLSADNNSWFCVQDNNTGLMWESKTDDNGLHDKDWTYSWYQPNATNTAGNIGTANGGSCGDGNSIDCDTEGFVQAVNTEGWCGHNDWRMPTDEELQSLISRAQTDLAINLDYFPLTQPSMYWSSSPTEDGKYAWYVSFGKGYHAWNLKDSARYVRLVRDVK